MNKLGFKTLKKKVQTYIPTVWHLKVNDCIRTKTLSILKIGNESLFNKFYKNESNQKNLWTSQTILSSN